MERIAWLDAAAARACLSERGSSVKRSYIIRHGSLISPKMEHVVYT